MRTTNEIVSKLKEHQSSTPSKWRENAEWRMANKSWLRYSQHIAMMMLDKMEELGMTQIRLKLTDKKTTKATNSQMVELHPVFTLEQTKRFRYGYRNVIVIRKMTFPNDKQLTIEMTENQISGRTISLKVNYSDVLSADSFNPIFLK